MSKIVYAIASDIHGSAVWCEKFLAEAKARGVEKILFLGDLLYHGPRNNLPDGYDTKKVAAMLSEVKDKAVCVRGNCDSEVDQMVLPFPVLADYAAPYPFLPTTTRNALLWQKNAASITPSPTTTRYATICCVLRAARWRMRRCWSWSCLCWRPSCWRASRMRPRRYGG